MVISQTDSIEFVVNESAFLALKSQQRRVESLFNVSITSDSTEGLRWVKVVGDEKLRMKAKDYIASLGKPECEKIIQLENLCCRPLNEVNLEDLLFGLELEFSASITFVDKSSIRVAGSEVSVAKVESYLCSVLSNIQNTDELPSKRARLESGSSVDSRGAASLNDDFPAYDEVEGLLGSLRESDGYDGLLDSASGTKENVDPAAMLQETSEDFAAKLGYSKDLYALAVRKIGKDADRNDLLNELVNIKNSTKEDRYEVAKNRPDRRRSPCVSATSRLRPIIIDGSNVAMSHGNQKIFSCRGIKIAVDWFKPRGHTSIFVVVPSWRKEMPSETNQISDQEVLRLLEEAGHMIFTPCRTVGNRRIVCYDDRYILKIAFERDGVVVSNDNFRDLLREKPEWKKLIEERVLMYSFVEDTFMPPEDPYGRHGPHLDELLSIGPSPRAKVCHYGRHCTYGRNCKYAHPEREGTGETVLRDTPSNSPRPYSEPVPLSDALLCEEFKRLSLPDLNRNPPPPVAIRTIHSGAPLPPAIPSRRPTQRAPPLPPRGDVLPRGLRTTSENPYGPLPVSVDPAAQMMQYLTRQQQPRLPPRHHPDYETLPFPRQPAHLPPRNQHHHYYNLPPTGVYVGNGNRRGRGGPYDNLPGNGGQMPIYPPRNHAIYQHNYYRSRAPPTDVDDDEDMMCVPEDRNSDLTEIVESLRRTESKVTASMNVA